jgi:hypothetical protein
MKKLLLSVAIAATCFTASASASEDNRDNDSSGPLTIAVIGDWPYNNLLLNNANLLIESVNADPRIALVLHVGDIHSGSQPCTSAGIVPPIATSNPGWNQAVFQQFQKFRPPVVYTPGDNEWTDCHKTKQFKSGDPLKELASVRGLFFSRPGLTLGINEMEVLTQAKHFSPAFPADAQFVENVMWHASRVVFVTLNVPGSNNNTLPWTNGFENPAVQSQEIANRNDANTRWIESAFALAAQRHAKAIVIGLQANMWDPAAVVPGGDGLNAYTPLVKRLADLTTQFGRPVLLLNGDTHLFESDKPLAVPTSATGVIHGTQAVPNLARITVQGSTNAPAEWLRLVIDATGDIATFSWTNVPYCNNPLTTCQ